MLPQPRSRHLAEPTSPEVADGLAGGIDSVVVPAGRPAHSGQLPFSTSLASDPTRLPRSARHGMTTNDPARSATSATPRDFYGYGPNPPHPQWPGEARIAINLNLNFEAGGERSLLEGDNQSEDMLNDIGFPRLFRRAQPDRRNGLRVRPAGRRLGGSCASSRSSTSRSASLGSCAACSSAGRPSKRSLTATTRSSAMAGDRSTITTWTKRRSASMCGSAIKGIRELTGRPPVGWFNGRPSQNTRKLLVEAGCFLYDRDALNDELPYWVQVEGRTSPDHPLFVGDQRQPLRPQHRFRQLGRFCPLHDRHLRSPLRRGRRRAEADEHRPARPSDRAARARPSGW